MILDVDGPGVQVLVDNNEHSLKTRSGDPRLRKAAVGLFGFSPLNEKKTKS